jgi:hypothetical protein
MLEYHDHLLASKKLELIGFQKLVWKQLLQLSYQSISIELYIIAIIVHFMKIFPELTNRQPSIMYGKVTDGGHN